MNIFSEPKTKILQILKQRGTISLLGWRKEVPLWMALIVLVGVATVYWVRYQSLKGQWKTYVNNRYGYSIDYPANWLMGEYGSNGSKGLIYLRNDFIDLFTLSVHIHQKDVEEPDLMEVIEWGEGLNRYTSNWSDVKTTTIGQGDYEALVRTHKIRSGILERRDTVKVYYVVTGHPGYCSRI
jgi:hypothetical protein